MPKTLIGCAQTSWTRILKLLFVKANPATVVFIFVVSGVEVANCRRREIVTPPIRATLHKHLHHFGNIIGIAKQPSMTANAILHGCTIASKVLIGLGATVLDGAVVESEVLVAAGAVVPPGKHLESGYVYGGNPVRQLRPLKESEYCFFEYSAGNYVSLKDEFLSQTE